MTLITLNSINLILRANEFDVTLGNIRVVILLHKKNGGVFLWPAVWQQPKGVTLSGILGKKLGEHLDTYSTVTTHFNMYHNVFNIIIFQAKPIFHMRRFRGPTHRL